MKTGHSIVRIDKDSEMVDYYRLSNEILNGLSAKRKYISSKYFYNDKGSRLFEKITSLDEYYLTRKEIEILKKRGKNISRYIDQDKFNLIELGAGSGKKTFLLIKHFIKAKLKPVYYPIDISPDALQTLIKNCSTKFPNMKCYAITAEYLDGIEWLETQKKIRNVILLLGSNVGNFTLDENYSFYKKLQTLLNDGDLILTGFDSVKDPEIILKAYNDDSGITYHCYYNIEKHRIESYLVSTKEQKVCIKKLNKILIFKKWEPIRTEYSQKYTINDIHDLAKRTGYKVLENLTDENKYFFNSLWRVQK
jgi:uncharacterized SAM-dependent methyltransferase